MGKTMQFTNVVSFRLGKFRAEGTLIKSNDYIIWVFLRRGGRSKAIKRHITKHQVRLIAVEAFPMDQD
jgi:hypothetical protein